MRLHICQTDPCGATRLVEKRLRWLVNLGAFHQSQVSAMLASIHGAASQILCLPLRQTAVAGAFTNRDACRHGSQPNVSRRHDDAQFRSGTGPDFQSLSSGQFFWAQLLFISTTLLGPDMANNERPVERTDACFTKMNPLTARESEGKCRGHREENNEKN